MNWMDWMRSMGTGSGAAVRKEGFAEVDEDERFRRASVRVVGEMRERMRRVSREEDDRVRRKFMLPERYVLILQTVETVGQERLLLDLLTAERLGVDLVICGRRTFYADLLLQTARRRRLALRTHFIYEYSPEELSAFFRMAEGSVYLPERRECVRPVVEAIYAGIPVVLTDTRRNRQTAGDAACYVAGRDPETLAAVLEEVLFDPVLRKRMAGCCRRRVERWEQTGGTE